MTTYFSNSVIHSTAKLINFFKTILVHEQSEDNMTLVNASIHFFRAQKSSKIFSPYLDAVKGIK
jgi:hypothetical protein